MFSQRSAHRCNREPIAGIRGPESLSGRPLSDVLADPDAASRFVHDHHPGMWRAAYALCGRADLADEAVQGAFERVVRHASRFDPHRPVAPWLHTIVINETRTLLADRTRRAEVALREADALLVDPAAQTLAVDALVHALGRLSFESRAAIVLRHLFGYSSSEVGEILGVPAATVRVRCARAIARLRDEAKID